jgi:tetratricopeptide (TPR) repeat protein
MIPAMEAAMRAYALSVAVALLLADAASGARAVDTNDLAPDLSSVRAKIKAKDFKGALEELNPLQVTHQHADVFNLLGFCLRKIGDHMRAYDYYRAALNLDPEHKGALEYLGELYIETGQIEKARENLAFLKRLCPDGCEELTTLAAAIAAAERK